MSQQIKILYRNIVENAAITVSSENASFPKYRLVDRSIAKLFKGASTPNPFFINFNQDKLFEVFESWASATDLNGWTEYLSGASTVNQESVVKEEGNYSCRLDIDAPGNAVEIYKTIPLAPATPHGILVRYRNSAPSKTGYFFISDATNKWFLQADGTWAPTGYAFTLPNSNGVFSTLILAFTTHPDIQSYLIDLGGRSAAFSSSIYFDYVIIHENWPANRIIIPKGHNLAGLTLSLTDGTSTILSWVAVPGLIDKSFAEVPGRFWYLNIASPWAAPEIPEIFIGKAYTFLMNPVWGARQGRRRNESNDESISGYDRDVKLGELRRFRDYELQNVDSTQEAELEAMETLCEGVKPVWLEDHLGNVFFAKVLNEEDVGYDQDDPLYSRKLQFREVLGR